MPASPVELGPIGELNLLLSTSMAPADAIEIREVAEDPARFAALMAALVICRSEVVASAWVAA